ncbi:MAG: putative dsRNA-binding protein, partial [archaeon]
LPDLPEIIDKELYRDGKSLFQEKAQEKTGITPIYKVLRASGPDHAKHFTVGVFLSKELIAEGSGSSKQEAEESAARKALEKK